MARVPTEVRRQQLIEAAMVVIAREGVDGATTRKIADEAKAPLATLHYCFQTKENLLWAVFEHLASLVRSDLEQASAPGQTVVEIACQLVDDVIESANEKRAASRAQIEIWLWAERNDSEFAVRIYALFIDASMEFLRRAKTPLPEEQLESVTRIIVAIMDGLIMQLITHGDEKMFRREAETAKAMLQAYLGRRARRAA